MCKYKAIKIDGKKYDEHRYIMEQFIGRKLEFNECVHHKDGNSENNNLSNLELINRGTHSSFHMKGRRLDSATIEKLIEYGRVISTSNSKYSVELILNIKRDLANGLRNVDICKKYNVNKFLVSTIKNNRRWNWIITE